MKIRLVFLIIFCFVSISLYSEIIAEVGSFIITQDDVDNYMLNSIISGDLDVTREEVLNTLIEEKLLLTYAYEHDVDVLDEEVEAYFIKEFGSDPKLVTDGYFDYLKFDELKETKEIQSILKEMKKDLQINKVQAILHNQFKLNDDKLIDQYVKENVQIDISYSLISENSANVPENCTPYLAYRFFENHRNDFKTEKTDELEFVLIQDDMFYDLIEIEETELLDVYDNTAQINSFDEVRDSLYSAVFFEKLREFSNDVARKASFRWQQGIEPDFPILKTGRINRNNKLAPLFTDDKIFNLIDDLQVGQVSDPIKLKDSYLILRLVDRKYSEYQEIEDVAEEVWEQYLTFIRKTKDKSEMEKFYEDNWEAFIVPAALVKKIEISKKNIEYQTQFPEKELRNYYNQHISEYYENGLLKSFQTVSNEIRLILAEDKRKHKLRAIVKELETAINNKSTLNNLIKKYNLHTELDVIFLEQFGNESFLDVAISDKILSTPYLNHDKIETDDEIIIFRVDTIFPDYIPSYDDLSEHLYKYMETSIIADSINYHLYYENNKKKLVSPDSLSIAGAIVPIITDSILVEDGEIEDYYTQNLENFFRKNSVSLDYVYIPDSSATRDSLSVFIYQELKDGIDLLYIKDCYHSEGVIPMESFTEIGELPQKIQKPIAEIAVGDFSEPLFYQNGWYVFYKIDHQINKYIPFDEAKSDILNKLKWDKADIIAQQKVQAIFDSTTYFYQCKAFVDSSQIFEIELQNTDLPFGPLGYIHEHKKALSRIYRNEKYSKIIKLDNGYAVVYHRKMKSSKQLSYEKSLKLIKQSLSEQEKSENVKAFLQYLREEILSGVDPNNIMMFFGGWKSLSNLNLDSKIPEIPYSSLIIDDAVQKKEGDLSRPLKVSKDQYLIYYVNRVSKADMDEFYSKKEIYRTKLVEKQISRWLSEYSDLIGIKKYQFDEENF